MAKKTFPIRYTNRDFDSIKGDLVEYAQRYYSDVFKDFNEASFGALMLDTVAYVGDLLSFYLDYQANESFIDTASEYENVIRLGQQFGYKYEQNQVSYGDISFYILIPATITGGEPDSSYFPVLNRSKDKDAIPSVLKAFSVARRFAVEQDQYATFLQFGYGSDSEIFNDPVADPSNVLLKIHGRNYITDDSFDPSNLIATDKFGIAPSNTRLRILYRTNSVANSNAATNSVNTVESVEFGFRERSSLSGESIQAVVDSLEITNEKRILGNVTPPTLSEIKTRIKGLYAAQNRAVTKEDYMNIIYSMSSEFGSVKRCNIVQDNDSFKRNINVYIACEDEGGKLVNHTTTLENNLITWLNNYKMINDTIDILPAKIVNFGIEFSIIGDLRVNKYDVLTRTTDALKRHFSRTYEIGEPLIISDIVKVINGTRGVTDTLDIKITNKFTAGYSDVVFDTDSNISADGRFLLVPEDFILEMRRPDDDIMGTIK